ncbi:hypothetical protein BJY04DRAFT_214141 [Aspergillus karnatakaensis]|uniref:uncharacterized protein n=1 Tax=Aspergillus karnatakaensis TaxID=1810916 RepID=UPI003CCE03DE
MSTSPTPEAITPRKRRLSSQPWTHEALAVLWRLRAQVPCLSWRQILERFHAAGDFPERTMDSLRGQLARMRNMTPEERAAILGETPGPASSTTSSSGSEDSEATEDEYPDDQFEVINDQNDLIDYSSDIDAGDIDERGVVLPLQCSPMSGQGLHSFSGNPQVIRSSSPVAPSPSAGPPTNECHESLVPLADEPLPSMENQISKIAQQPIQETIPTETASPQRKSSPIAQTQEAGTESLEPTPRKQAVKHRIPDERAQDSAKRRKRTPSKQPPHTPPATPANPDFALSLPPQVSTETPTPDSDAQRIILSSLQEYIPPQAQNLNELQCLIGISHLLARLTQTVDEKAQSLRNGVGSNDDKDEDVCVLRDDINDLETQLRGLTDRIDKVESDAAALKKRLETWEDLARGRLEGLEERIRDMKSERDLDRARIEEIAGDLEVVNTKTQEFEVFMRRFNVAFGLGAGGQGASA